VEALIGKRPYEEKKTIADETPELTETATATDTPTEPESPSSTDESA
jgi:hypothetical protein